MINKNKMKLLAVAIAAIIVLSGVIAFFELTKEEEKPKEQIIEKEIDNRISPFLSQSLTVEILRIRNRGLMEKMLKFGTSWKKPPVFYWIVDVDGKIGDSAHIEAAGGISGEGTFNEWDNILKECRANFKIEDEQEKSDIKITIMEQQKTGFLGKTIENNKKEEFRLSYSYKTGHWTGGDYLGDKDGYGHYLGKDYEIWFNIYQSDYDQDGIPFWTEVNIYETDPTIDDSRLDPDNDGIPSSWEWKYGYDPNTWDNHMKLDPDVDGIENIEEYMIRKYFSDPFFPDIYIETDGMEKGGLFDWEHIFFKESQQMIIEIFAQHGINVYIDDGWPDGPVNGGGEMLDFVETLDEVVGGHMSRWYKHNFADERKGIFRYVVIGNNAGFITASTYNNYDHVVMDTSVYKTLARRLAFTPRMQRVVLAKGVLHELGHSLGLTPWAYYGIDASKKAERWPETLSSEEHAKYVEHYYSVMNYAYIFFPRDLFDLSDGSRHPKYDFDDWGHIYIPGFQTDVDAVEEPIDETFDDFEILDKHPEPVYKSWIYDENLTLAFLNQITQFNLVKNANVNYRIYVRTEEKDLQNDIIDIRVYIKPDIAPVVALWSLVAEGKLDIKENDLEFYSYNSQYDEVMAMI
jgi:hypothetical protein